MLKTIIFTALIAAVALFVLQGCGSAKRVPPTIHASGKFANLEAQFDDLINGRPPRGSMVIDLTGSGDFVQFDYVKGTVEIDFPVFTDRQKELEPVFREVCEELGLTIRETTDPEGNRFLDADIASNSAEAARIAGTFLTRLFEADENTELGFTLYPLPQ